jgi:hypothetical protein
MKEIQAEIPTLSDAVLGYWKGKVEIPQALLE